VIGFRQWNIRDDRLHSPFRGDVWDDVELHANCERRTDDPADAPAADCECGVYAYYDQPPRSSAARRDLVIGAVVVSGQIQLHGAGMRASHARIVGLALPPTSGARRRRLLAAAAYLEVPVVAFRQLKAIAVAAARPRRSRCRSRCGHRGPRRRGRAHTPSRESAPGQRGFARRR
jgi:hypothetical protein